MEDDFLVSIADISRHLEEHPESQIHVPKIWVIERLKDTNRWFISHRSYCIELDRCLSKQNKLHWVRHMEEKTWVTNEMLGELYRFLFSFNSSMFERDYAKLLAKLPHSVVED